MTDPLRRFSPWFYAAAAYNLVWGITTVLAPASLVGPLAVDQADLVAWQVVGMLVLVYVPAYWWAARRPSSYPHLIVVALLGKILGPVGFVWAGATGRLPLEFGLIVVANDVIWLPAFSLYVREAARMRGGLGALFAGA